MQKKTEKKKSPNRSEITDHILSGLGRISFQFSLQKILATSCRFKFTKITANNYYNSFISDSVLSVFVYLRQYLSEPLSLSGSAAFVIFSTLEILSVYAKSKIAFEQLNDSILCRMYLYFSIMPLYQHLKREHTIQDSVGKTHSRV